MPNNLENSIELLKFIADEISTNVAISIMSQYFVSHKAKSIDSLNRKLTKAEYEKVVETIGTLEFSKGWIQELNSSDNYLPNFNKKNAFE